MLLWEALAERGGKERPEIEWFSGVLSLPVRDPLKGKLTSQQVLLHCSWRRSVRGVECQLG